MSEHRAMARLLLFATIFSLLVSGSLVLAQDARRSPATKAGPDPISPEDQREQRAMERFLTLLERNPRRGTALDRVYGYHVERGSLDAFVKRLQERVARDPKDGAGWMILGLVESQRGRDAAAIKALAKAEQARPDDPMAPFYLGQSLVLIGRPEEAAAAWDASISAGRSSTRRWRSGDGSSSSSPAINRCRSRRRRRWPRRVRPNRRSSGTRSWRRPSATRSARLSSP
jgi:predicted Zn-dependent protease